jgi:transposase-like protein
METGKGATGRVEGRWTREDGQRVVAAWRKSGLGLASFARTQGIGADRVRYWRNALAGEEQGGKVGQAQARPISVLPVVLRPDRPRVKAGPSDGEGLDAARRIDPLWVATFVSALLAGGDGT